MINDPAFRKSPLGRLYRWGPVLVCMGMLFILSAQPDLPDIPCFYQISWSDKIHHFLAYSILGALVWRALSRTAPKWWQIGATVALATAYGVTDESHQMYVPGRCFDLLDLSADAFGSAIAATVLTIWMGGDNIARRTRENIRGKG